MTDSCRTVGLLLLPQFSQLSFAAATEPLLVANWLSGRELYRWRTLSLDGRPAISSTGQRLPVDAGIGGARRFDLLLAVSYTHLTLPTTERV